MMKKIRKIILIIVTIINTINANCKSASYTTVSGRFAPKGKICRGNLIFEDNFDEFNLQKWQHELTLAGGGNWEFQWYLNNRSNSYVENGTLFIRPTLTADEFGDNFLYHGTLDISGSSPVDQCTNAMDYGCVRTGSSSHILNPIKSARIRTADSFAFKYGKLEVRAKIPSGDWLWPAIWLLPRWNQYSTWPSSGEIDIMESRGNKNLFNSKGINIGTQQVTSTLHFGPNVHHNRQNYAHFEKQNAKGFDADFHLYQLNWTPDNISFSIDDEVVGTVTPPEGGFWELGHLGNTGLDNPWKRNTKMAPFDQEFYIILNLAVGGISYFPDDAVNSAGDKPWLNTSPHAATDFWNGRNNWLPTWNSSSDSSAFQIDYVRIWAI